MYAWSVIHKQFSLRIGPNDIVQLWHYINCRLLSPYLLYQNCWNINWCNNNPFVFQSFCRYVSDRISRVAALWQYMSVTVFQELRRYDTICQWPYFKSCGVMTLYVSDRISRVAALWQDMSVTVFQVLRRYDTICQWPYFKCCGVMTQYVSYRISSVVALWHNMSVTEFQVLWRYDTICQWPYFKCCGIMTRYVSDRISRVVALWHDMSVSVFQVCGVMTQYVSDRISSVAALLHDMSVTVFQVLQRYNPICQWVYFKWCGVNDTICQWPYFKCYSIMTRYVNQCILGFAALWNDMSVTVFQVLQRYDMSVAVFQVLQHYDMTCQWVYSKCCGVMTQYISECIRSCSQYLWYPAHPAGQ